MSAPAATLSGSTPQGEFINSPGQLIEFATAEELNAEYEPIKRGRI